MSTYVYFIGCVDIITKSLTAIKIGISENPINRLTDLQGANANDLVILRTIPCENKSQALELEKSFHDIYEKDQLNGEWFSITADILREIYQILPDRSSIVEIRTQSQRQRINQRTIKILKDTPNLSAKQIQNRMKWAHLSEIEESLEYLLRRNAIKTETPKRTILYSIQEPL